MARLLFSFNRISRFRLAAILLLNCAVVLPEIAFGGAFGAPVPESEKPDSQYLVLTAPGLDLAAPDSMLFFFMDSIAHEMFCQREERLERVKTKQQWEAWLDEAREKFHRMLGEFPKERPPIEAKLAGRVERPDYTIEKIVFEALPDYPLTALVYVPKNFDPPYPAFLCPVGHSPEGKVGRSYAGRRLSLARKGYLVIAIDPIGLGERKPLVNPVTGTSLVEMREHSHLGHQTLLTGTNLAMYFLWDGMRAIDYLYTRPDVDTSRIACAGISGGGNVTSWLAAYDDRIEVAMPVCHVTSNKRRWESLGAADAEQNLLPCIADGLEYGDVLMLVAPRPLLIACTSRDFFPIRGAYEAFHDAMRYYRFLGVSERLRISEVPGGHSWPMSQRRNTYGWVNQWCGKSETGVEEEPFEPDTWHDLLVTETGLQHTAFGKKDIFELNRDYARSIAPDFGPLESLGQFEPLADSLRTSLCRLTGFAPSGGELEAAPAGRIERDGLVIEKLLLSSEPGVYLPSLLFRPAGAAEAGKKLPALVYCHDRGKEAEAGEGELVPRLARSGMAVLCIDLRGTGETRTFRQYRDTEEGYHAMLWGSETNMAFDAFMIGRSLLGQRAADVVRAADYLRSRPDIDPGRIACFGQEEAAMAVLVAAALDERFSAAVLSRLPVSYRSIVENRLQNWHVSIFLNGVLKSMDIPQIAGLVAPRPLMLLNTADHLRRRLSLEAVEREYGWTRQVFSLEQAGKETGKKFRVSGYDSPEEKFREISRWLKRKGK